MDKNNSNRGSGVMFTFILIMLIFSFAGMFLYLYNMFEFIIELEDILTFRSIATYITDLIFHVAVIVLLFFGLVKSA